MSATVTDSSTSRRLARTATHSFPSCFDLPEYFTISGGSPRTLASGPSTARIRSAIVISSAGPRQPVAALGAALAAHEPGVLELAEDVLEELERYVLGLGEPLSLDRAVAGGGQLDGRPDCVIRFRRDAHALHSANSIDKEANLRCKGSRTAAARSAS